MDESRAKTERGAKAYAPLRLRQIQVTILQGPNQGAVYLLGSSAVRVGKSPDNDIVLADPTVSRKHLRLLRTVRGCLVEDLGSTNGTLLDGSSIRQGFVRSGSVIKAGDVVMEIRWRWIQPDLGREPPPRDFPFVASSDIMRRVVGAVRFVQGLRCPVTLIGEPGTGRRSLANWMLRSQGGSIRVSEIDANRFRGSREGPRHRAELRAAVSSCDAVILVEPWMLGPGLQRELFKGLEEQVGLTERVHLDGGGGSAFRVISIFSENPRDLMAEGRWDQRLGDYLTAAIIEVPPLRQRRRDMEVAVSRILEARAQRFPGGLGEVFLQSRDWMVAVLSRMTLPRNWLDLEEFVLAALETGLAHQGAAPLSGGAVGHPLTEGITFGQWKAQWIAEAESRYLTWLLERSGGNISAAARMAHMDRKHLTRLARRHGLLGDPGHGKGAG